MSTLRKLTRYIFPTLAFSLAIGLIVGSLPNPVFKPQKAKAATFSMASGYYIGTGAASHAITGLGWQPNMVIIKADTTAGVGGVWKTSAMPASHTALFTATANDTNTMITFTSDGFTLSAAANVNTINVRWTWVAFSGSDCSATGTFCVGTYAGNGGTQNITSVGFQPDFVMTKAATGTTNRSAIWRSSSMAGTVSNYFIATAQLASAGITGLLVNGFSVGNNVATNTTSTTYYYAAFKNVTDVMHVGSYVGNGPVDSYNITGFGSSGAVPDFVFVKGTAAVAGVMHSPHTYGNYSSLFIDSANATGHIKARQANGFQVGTSTSVNGLNTTTFHWVGFKGVASPSPSGTFSMDTGTYSGNGVSQSISGLGFAPDLVIVKDISTNYAVFRTRIMPGTGTTELNTAFLANAAVNGAQGITVMGSDGFSVGNAATVNAGGGTYYWQAFGNAYNPHTNSGAADFAIGAYTGNGIDSRDIENTGIDPDFVAIKRSGTSAGIWRSSSMVGDVSSMFAAAADASNNVQSLSATDGFQVGNAANVNTAANIYWWFAFKEGTRFDVDNYTGSGANDRSVATPGWQPDLVWVKRSTGTTGGGLVMRNVDIPGDSTQYATNFANAANRIDSLTSTGFQVDNSTEVNTASTVYRYAVWRIQESTPGSLSVDIVDSNGIPVASPAVSMSNTSFSFSCETATGTFGTNNERIRVNNTTASPAWRLDVAASIATAVWDGAAADFDFNDSGGSGCTDSGDTDSVGGQMTQDASGATLVPQVGCTNTGVSLGTSESFAEGSNNDIDLLNASGSAETSCYWDLTDITVSQKIPREQPVASDYDINLILTITSL